MVKKVCAKNITIWLKQIVNERQVDYQVENQLISNNITTVRSIQNRVAVPQFLFKIVLFSKSFFAKNTEYFEIIFLRVLEGDDGEKRENT